jgi:hypothetical protein
MLRTPLPGRGLPAAETVGRRWLIRSIAVTALLVNVACATRAVTGGKVTRDLVDPEPLWVDQTAA